MKSKLSFLLNILLLNAFNKEKEESDFKNMDEFISKVLSDKVEFDPVKFERLFKELERNQQNEEKKK